MSWSQRLLYAGWKVNHNVKLEGRWPTCQVLWVVSENALFLSLTLKSIKCLQFSPVSSGKNVLVQKPDTLYGLFHLKLKENVLIIYSRSEDHVCRAVSFPSPLLNIHHSLNLQSSQTHWLAGVLSPGIDSACEAQIRRPRCGKKFSSSTHCPTVTPHICTFKQFHVNQWVITGGITERPYTMHFHYNVIRDGEYCTPLCSNDLVPE